MLSVLYALNMSTIAQACHRRGSTLLLQQHHKTSPRQFFYNIFQISLRQVFHIHYTDYTIYVTIANSQDTLKQDSPQHLSYNLTFLFR